MIVSIHQPNFLPWLGFFHKLMCADVFILLDNVAYSKNSFQNRVKIKSAQSGQWLTVPVLTKGLFGQATNEVRINMNSHWSRAHQSALRTNYQRAPRFDEVMEWIEPVYREPDDLLGDFNTSLLRAVLKYLDYPAKLITASSLVSEKSGPELLLKLVQAVGGKVYLSGPSGHDYLDVSIFEQGGIQVEFQQFSHPVYSQLYGDFIPGLSVLDLLMNVDPSKAMKVLKQDLIGKRPTKEPELIEGSIVGK